MYFFLAALQLQLVGRNFFDADAKTAIPEFRIELWPGYITSIRQHEPDVLVCVEFIHKAMRMETIYDIMARARREERDFKTALAMEVLGTTVLTDYNNKTYYIDDIDYTKKPSDTFETKNGPVTFVDYYRTVSRATRIGCNLRTVGVIGVDYNCSTLVNSVLNCYVIFDSILLAIWHQY